MTHSHPMPSRVGGQHHDVVRDVTAAARSRRESEEELVFAMGELDMCCAPCERRGAAPSATATAASGNISDGDDD
jgi:hypothetical protein